MIVTHERDIAGVDRSSSDGGSTDARTAVSSAGVTHALAQGRPRLLAGADAHRVLVVLAIALGIAAFSAVLSSYAILDRELNQGYLATNPASATLRTDAIDDDAPEPVDRAPGVAAAEARRVAARADQGRARPSGGA